MNRGPHVVLLVVDTVRADMAGLGAPGPSAMPALREFARAAAVYPDAYTTAPWTPPAHASLFTGAWVWRHGCGGGRQRLDAGLPTLAERLAAAGYATGAVSANAWLGPGSGFERGFARFVKAWQLVDRGGDLAGVRRAGRASGRTDLAEAVRRARAGGLTATGVNGLHHLLWRRHGRLGGGRVARRTVDVARELAAGGRPVFLFVNFLDAHLPYRAPRRYRRAVLGRRARPARRVNQDPWAFVSGAVAMTGDELELLRGLYAAELAHVDDRARQLLDGVDEVLGLDDTLVVVVSDHGEHLGEHGLMDHQYSLSETLLRVPLAVRWPGGEHAGAHAGLRQLVDVAPTVLDAAGLPVPEEPGLGRPLGGQARSWALAEYPEPQPSMAAHARRGDPAPFRRFDRALRALRLADGRKVVTGSDGSLALYDLASDPGELHDLAAARPSEAAELANRLARITGGARGAPTDRGTPPGFPGPLRPDPAEPSRSSEHEVRRALQSLGYIE